VVVQFYFGYWSLFSGQTLYEPWIYQMYNIFFTALPIVWYAVFDFEYEKSVLILNPELYDLGLKKKGFNLKVFWGWVLFAFWQALLIVAFVTYVSQNEGAIIRNGN